MVYYFYPICDSTNLEAKRILNKFSTIENVVVVSETQSKGRGRRGNKWESTSNEGLYFSIGIRFANLSLKRHEEAYKKIADIVIQSIKLFSGVDAELDWPNDIVISGKKVGGILIETATGSLSDEPKYAIIGIGLNINQESFKKDLQYIAISLKQVTKRNFEKYSFINFFSKEILNAFKRR